VRCRVGTFACFAASRRSEIWDDVAVRIVSIDGVVVPAEQATISIFDRGFLYGDGLFETFRTWDGVAVDWPEHEARLHASAAALQMRVGAIDIATAIAAAGGGEHRVKVIVTRGPGAPGARLATLGPGRVIVIVEPLGEVARTVTARIVDLPLARRAAGHKMLGYVENLIARELAAPADEAIRLDADGFVAEGAMSNVFVVEDGVAWTPGLGAGVLGGIVRGHVIGLGARERRISVDDLRRADEVFVTSAIRGVAAVTQLDDGVRAVGPVTADFAARYERTMRERAQYFVVNRRVPD
jgi:branched-subunit amino acid aminotransferase/4-amino-4-deoxychorismate lyase